MCLPSAPARPGMGGAGAGACAILAEVGWMVVSRSSRKGRGPPRPIAAVELASRPCTAHPSTGPATPRIVQE